MKNSLDLMRNSTLITVADIKKMFYSYSTRLFKNVQAYKIKSKKLKVKNIWIEDKAENDSSKYIDSPYQIYLRNGRM